MKVEVDLTELATAVSNAILAFATPKSNQKIVKKKGRPKKETNISSQELDTKKDDFTAPPRKIVNQNESDDYSKKGSRRVKFTKKKRVNQFIDDLKIASNDLYHNGKKIVYPDHTLPRPEQKMIEYRCGLCNNLFQAFPSYISVSVDGESQPIIRCYNCNSK